jgi:hypothetical protein
MSGWAAVADDSTEQRDSRVDDHMHERANTLNGTITIQRTPNLSTAIRARIPVNPPDEEGPRA